MPRIPSPFILASVTLAAVSAASADATNTARVVITPAFIGGSGPVDLSDSHIGTCDATGSTTGGFGASGTATTHTEYGSIRVLATANAPLVSSGIGTVNDTITILSPGVPAGTPGTLTYSIRVGGNVASGGGSSVATWNVQTDIAGGAFDITKTGNRFSPNLGGNYTGDAFGIYTATVSFQYGVPRTLFFQLRGTANSANASTTNIGEAHVDGPLTLDWLGMTNLTANGSPVGSFSVSSESGTNWGGDLTPVTCDSIDFNGDGLYPDTQDIDDFLSVFSGGPCSTGTCGDIDFNNDGLFPDTSDIDSLLSVFSGGPCV